ncbi:MAG: hypothetical protein WAM97_19035, partial [Acidimicrobiales bacterium]
PFEDLYFHTIQVGRFVAQVRGFPNLPVGDNVALQRLLNTNFAEIPIFPPADVCRWPPVTALGEEDLARYTTGGKEPPVAPPALNTTP